MLLPRTAATISSATRAFLFRRASSTASPPSATGTAQKAEAAAKKAKEFSEKIAKELPGVAGDAAQKAKVLSEKIGKELPGFVNTVAANSQKLLDAPAARKAMQSVRSTALGFYANRSHRFRKLERGWQVVEPVVSQLLHVLKVSYHVGREVAIRERFWPPGLDQVPVAKAEFRSLVYRMRPYFQDPYKVEDVVKAEVRGIIERRQAYKKAIAELAKSPTAIEGLSPTAIKELNKPIVLVPNVVAFFRSVFVIFELFTFFLVGEIIGRGNLIGYNVPDTRPKDDHH